jgi:hypothetical protein
MTADSQLGACAPPWILRIANADCFLTHKVSGKCYPVSKIVSKTKIILPPRGPHPSPTLARAKEPGPSPRAGASFFKFCWKRVPCFKPNEKANTMLLQNRVHSPCSTLKDLWRNASDQLSALHWHSACDWLMMCLLNLLLTQSQNTPQTQPQCLAWDGAREWSD